MQRKNMSGYELMDRHEADGVLEYQHEIKEMSLWNGLPSLGEVIQYSLFNDSFDLRLLCDFCR